MYTVQRGKDTYSVDEQGLLPEDKVLRRVRGETLWDNEVTMYENEATSSTFVKLDSHFMTEHFNPEVVVGYAGA